jgi:hypothetical protein
MADRGADVTSWPKGRGGYQPPTRAASLACPGPDSTDFRALTQSALDTVAAELNDRPRQTLGWKSPCQALDEALR